MKPSVTFVCGMHRSGTSLLSRYLENFEFHFHDSDLIKGRKFENENGFYESEKFNNINREILKFNKTSWYEIYDKKYIYSQKSFKDATIFLKNNIKEGKSIILKDPRATILLDFWSAICSEIGITFKVIFIFRDYNQVSQSLLQRSNFPKILSNLIWFNYNYSFIKNSNKFDVCMIDYNNFIHDVKKLPTFLSDNIIENNNVELKEKKFLLSSNRQVDDFYENLYQFMINDCKPISEIKNLNTNKNNEIQKLITMLAKNFFVQRKKSIFSNFMNSTNSF
jgi:hypothetical protein